MGPTSWRDYNRAHKLTELQLRLSPRLLLFRMYPVLHPVSADLSQRLVAKCYCGGESLATCDKLTYSGIESCFPVPE